MAETEPRLIDFTLLIDFDSAGSRSVLWTLSLLFATSSYLSLKPTAMYAYYSLGDFDRSTPVVIVSIVLIHLFLATLCFRNPRGYLIDFRRRSKTMRKIADGVGYTLFMMMFGFWRWNDELMREAPTMSFLMTFAAFLMVFVRVVTPGFGRMLPIMASGASVYISYQIGLLWTLMPWFAVIVVAQVYLHEIAAHVKLRPLYYLSAVFSLFISSNGGAILYNEKLIRMEDNENLIRREMEDNENLVKREMAV